MPGTHEQARPDCTSRSHQLNMAILQVSLELPPAWGASRSRLARCSFVFLSAGCLRVAFRTVFACAREHLTLHRYRTGPPMTTQVSHGTPLILMRCAQKRYARSQPHDLSATPAPHSRIEAPGCLRRSERLHTLCPPAGESTRGRACPGLHLWSRPRTCPRSARRVTANSCDTWHTRSPAKERVIRQRLPPLDRGPAVGRFDVSAMPSALVLSCARPRAC